MLEREKELMREHIKKVGLARLILIYLIVIIIIIIIEAFASYNIYTLQSTGSSGPVLTEAFPIMAIMVAVLSIIARTVLLGERDKAAKEFNYYFRIRPLVVFSVVAIAGDLVALTLSGETSYPYVVFFTSFIAISLYTMGFAVFSAEKAMPGKKKLTTHK
jgi:hypothetical protein